jgi:hypothetical protein
MGNFNEQLDCLQSWWTVYTSHKLKFFGSKHPNQCMILTTTRSNMRYINFFIVNFLLALSTILGNVNIAVYYSQPQLFMGNFLWTTGLSLVLVDFNIFAIFSLAGHIIIVCLCPLSCYRSIHNGSILLVGIATCTCWICWARQWTIPPLRRSKHDFHTTISSPPTEVRNWCNGYLFV